MWCGPGIAVILVLAMVGASCSVDQGNTETTSSEGGTIEDPAASRVVIPPGAASVPVEGSISASDLSDIEPGDSPGGPHTDQWRVWAETQEPQATTTTALSTITESRGPVPGLALADSERDRIVIHGTGDVSLDDRQLAGALGRNGHEWAWSGLDGLFERDDLTVINLECIPSMLGTPRDKKFTFRCDLDGLSVMAASGVDVANMANNHAGDFGSRALLDGRANLIRSGVRPVGAGRDLAQAIQPAYVEVGGWTIATFGFSLVTGGDGWFAGANQPGVAWADQATMVAAITAADAVADLIVVSIHWGEGGDRTPRAINHQLAQAMIEVGVDIIFGHHSHRRNPMEIIDGKPVFWGLGNFVWPDLDIDSSRGAVGEVVVEPDGSITGRLLPSLVESDGHPVLLTQPDWTLRVGPNRLG